MTILVLLDLSAAFNITNHVNFLNWLLNFEMGNLELRWSLSFFHSKVDKWAESKASVLQSVPEFETFTSAFEHLH